MPDPTPLEEARQRAVDVFRDPDSDETDATNVLMVLEAQAKAEAVEPLLALLREVRGWSAGPEWTVINRAIERAEARHTLSTSEGAGRG